MPRLPLLLGILLLLLPYLAGCLSEDPAPSAGEDPPEDDGWFQGTCSFGSPGCQAPLLGSTWFVVLQGGGKISLPVYQIGSGFSFCPSREEIQLRLIDQSGTLHDARWSLEFPDSSFGRISFDLPANGTYFMFLDPGCGADADLVVSTNYRFKFMNSSRLEEWPVVQSMDIVIDLSPQAGPETQTHEKAWLVESDIVGYSLDFIISASSFEGNATWLDGDGTPITTLWEGYFPRNEQRGATWDWTEIPYPGTHRLTVTGAGFSGMDEMLNLTVPFRRLPDSLLQEYGFAKPHGVPVEDLNPQVVEQPR